MTRRAILLLTLGATSLMACEGPSSVPVDPAPAPDASPRAAIPPAPTPPAPMVSGLAFMDEAGREAARLTCGPTEPLLSVRVSGFQRIGSEDRLTLGAETEAFALAADMDDPGAGVIATGAIPDALLALVARGGSLTAVYGAQNVGPLSPPPAEARDRFVQGCRALQPARLQGAL